MRFLIKSSLFLFFVALVCAALAACSSDCIYKLYTTSAGDQLCGRFCPLEDDEGNDVVDSNGDVVYDKPESVNKVNCILPSSSSTSSTSSTSSSSSSTSSSGLL
jgi:hypothetical protein